MDTTETTPDEGEAASTPHDASMAEPASSEPASKPTSSEPTSDAASSEPTGFAALDLRPELLAALDELGYEEPTPIQRETIPPLLAGQ